MNRPGLIPVLSALAGSLLLLATWALLAPSQLGGNATYLSTVGNSMEPGLHAGDLTIVRKANRYRIGDVVAYHSGTLDTTVLHRIVGEDERGFVTKGDNNRWLDPDRPRPDELLGTKWLVIGGGGRVLGWLREPTVTAVLVALVALSAGGTATAVRRHRSRDRRRARRPLVSRTAPAILAAGGRLVIPTAVAAVCFTGLMILSWTRPTTTAVKMSHPYEQHGRFDYGAAVPAGPVYQHGHVRTGDPVFLKLVNKLYLTFDYRFETTARAVTSGTTAMSAELMSSTGWRTTLPLVPQTPFHGDQRMLSSSIDLQSMRSLIDEVEKQTGDKSGHYTLTIVPEVRATGTVAGQPLHAAPFSPRLSFRLDAQQLRLAGGGVEAAAPRPELEPSTRGAVQAPRTAPAQLVAVGRRIQVDQARVVSVVGAAVSLLVLGSTCAARSRWPDDQRAVIQAKYGKVLIPVDSVEVGPQRHVVDLATMDGLVRVAERYDRMVLVHHDAQKGDAYLVEDGATLFRYRPAQPPMPSAVPDEDGESEHEAA